MPKSKIITVLSGAAALGSLAFLSSPASATVIDPQIFIQQSGSSPAGGDPNLITNPGAFTVGVAGNFTLQNPLLIIIGVYNGNGVPSISFAGCAAPSACPGATVGTYGLTSNTGTLSAGQDAYTQLGLTEPGSGSDSESYQLVGGRYKERLRSAHELYALRISASGKPYIRDANHHR